MVELHRPAGQQGRHMTSHSRVAFAKSRKETLVHYAGWGLLLHDFVALNAAFWFALWLDDFFVGGLDPQKIHSVFFLLVSSALLIAFFSSHQLYSYHVIFLPKKHIATLVRSLVWGLCTVGLVFVFCRWPAFLDSAAGIALVICCCVAFLLMSRFFVFELLDLIRSVGLSFLAIGFLGLFSGEDLSDFFVNRMALVPTIFFGTVLLVISRHVFVNLVLNRWLRFHFRRQIAVIGSNQEANRIADYIIEYNAPFWVTGFVGVCERETIDTCVPKEALGSLEDLPEIVSERQVREVIVTDEKLDKPTLVSLLDYCTSEGLSVWFPPKLLPIINMKLHIDNFCGLQMIRLCTRKGSYFMDWAERAIDLVVAVLLFVLFLPFFLMIAAAVKIDSRGPVFYRARAIGRKGRGFTMLKFRSMAAESDNKIHKDFVTKLIKGEMNKDDHPDGVLKITNDSRVTRVGRLLRKFSMDELPQIINVIKGDMSFVGPRPCLPYEYEIYKDWHKKRTVVRPGITGVWQIAGRSDVAFDDMILLDLYYIYNRSILMYMNICYETIFAVLTKRGAY